MNVVAAIAPRLTGEYVYRCFDADDRLLYVGLSNDVKARWRQHRTGSAWFGAAVRFTLTGPFADRATASRYEADAIRAESPLHNVQHVGTSSGHVRPLPEVEALHEAFRRSGIPPGTLVRALDRGRIEDCSDESLLAWIATWPELREIADRNARRRWARSA